MFGFGIIDRYIAREIIYAFLAVMSILLLIFLGRYSARFLADVASGEIPGSLMIDLLLLKTVSATNMMFPFSLFLAVLLAFGRFYKDSEMTAMLAAGMSIGRLTKSVFIMASFCSIAVAYLALVASPWAEKKALELLNQSQMTTELEGILPGQFNVLDKSTDSVFYAEKVSDDRKQMFNVFVQYRKSNSVDFFSAQSAYQQTSNKTGDRYLVLVNGHRYRGEPGDLEFVIQRYDKTAIRLESKSDNVIRLQQRAIKTVDLLDAQSPHNSAELQWRLSMIVSTILLAILSILISRTSPRQGRFSKLFIAILIYVIYNNMLSISRSAVEQGELPEWLGLWWVHLSLAAILLFMLIQQSGSRWLLQRKKLLTFANVRN